MRCRFVRCGRDLAYAARKEPNVSPRSRDRILANLESVYREAYGRADAMGDKARMSDLDSAYQREQLILEVLLDVRDALAALADAPTSASALEKLQALRKLTKSR